MTGVICLQGGREFTTECREMDAEVLRLAGSDRVAVLAGAGSGPTTSMPHHARACTTKRSAPPSSSFPTRATTLMQLSMGSPSMSH